MLAILMQNLKVTFFYQMYNYLENVIEDNKHYIINCPYYDFDSNILVNELNNIGFYFELETP